MKLLAANTYLESVRPRADGAGHRGPEDGGAALQEVSVRRVRRVVVGELDPLQRVEAGTLLQHAGRVEQEGGLQRHRKIQGELLL